ncbi:hypothetical protein L9F63_026175, partial [Diploptera punctata]
IRGHCNQVFWEGLEYFRSAVLIQREVLQRESVSLLSFDKMRHSSFSSNIEILRRRQSLITSCINNGFLWSHVEPHDLREEEEFLPIDITPVTNKVLRMR